MVATLTKMPALPRRKPSRPSTGQGGPTPTTRPSLRGERVAAIPGRYTPITTHQLCMVWWLYQAGHITKRQLRVYFAAQEMAERRRYTKPDAETGRPRRPSYTLDEVRDLIGSKSGEAAEKALSADVKALGHLGLVKVMAHRIEFARSIEQIAVEAVGGFWTMFEQMKNKARVVPVPRRTTRALAKGMTKGETGMVLALLIRSLFWHKREGEYRIDGRTKCSWIAEVFGLDRKTVTTARASLIAKGWMEEIPCDQWELNKWGQRYRLNLDAFGPPQKVAEEEGASGVDDGLDTDPATAVTPSPGADLSVVFPSPCLNSSSSSNEENLKNRKPDRSRSGSASAGSRKKKVGKSSAGKPPRLTDIRGEDLVDTDRLLELHRQAIEAGHKVGGEKGRLEFVALAERAIAHGEDPPRLFAWMLREGRFEFITMADEDAAMTRLREHRDAHDPNATTSGVGDSQRSSTRPRRVVGQTREAFLAGLGEDERFVDRCIVVGRQHKVDPFRIAQAKGWTRDRWDQALMAYKLAEQQRWRTDDSGEIPSEQGAGFIHLMDFEGDG